MKPHDVDSDTVAFIARLAIEHYEEHLAACDLATAKALAIGDTVDECAVDADALRAEWEASEPPPGPTRYDEDLPF